MRFVGLIRIKLKMFLFFCILKETIESLLLFLLCSMRLRDTFILLFLKANKYLFIV
jgi:hypothetical protein